MATTLLQRAGAGMVWRTGGQSGQARWGWGHAVDRADREEQVARQRPGEMGSGVGADWAEAAGKGVRTRGAGWHNNYLIRKPVRTRSSRAPPTEAQQSSPHSNRNRNDQISPSPSSPGPLGTVDR